MAIPHFEAFVTKGVNSVQLFVFLNFLLSVQNYNYFYNIKHLLYFFSNVTHLSFSRPIITELVYLWINLTYQSKTTKKWRIQ
jgi:hypothetical protein